jgi:hypothetical protein
MTGGRGGRGGIGLLASAVLPVILIGLDGVVGGVLRVDFLEKSSLLPFIARECTFSLELPIDSFDIILCNRPDPLDFPFSKETELVLA